MSRIKTPRDRVWKVMFKKESFLEEKRRCSYCKSEMTFAESTADHVVPRSKGGRTTRENIKAACDDCNQAKGSESEGKFLAMIKKPPGPDVPFHIMLIWMRRKIALQTIRSCTNLERMFIGEEISDEELRRREKYLQTDYA